jgi:phosphatidylinositol dimannoside acyltransferase
VTRLLAASGRRVRAFTLASTLRLALFLSRLAPAVVVPPLCRAASLVWWFLATPARHGVRANLRIILGREPRPLEIAEVFYHGALNYWDTFQIAHVTPRTITKHVTMVGWHYLDEAFERGRGVILAGAHLSSAGLAGQAIVCRGFPVTAVVEPVQPPEVLDFFNSVRGARGAGIVVAGRKAIRPIVAALRRGEIVAMVADRDVLGTGRPVLFLGHTTTFPEGPASLAVRTGAAIVPAYAYRDSKGRLYAEIDRPIEFTPSGAVSQDVMALTAALADRLGDYIKANPLQWTVFQSRWPRNDQ